MLQEMFGFTEVSVLRKGILCHLQKMFLCCIWHHYTKKALLVSLGDICERQEKRCSHMFNPNHLGAYLEGGGEAASMVPRKQQKAGAASDYRCDIPVT